jgi:aminotransferase
MWTELEIEDLAKAANKHNLLVITDEMYEYFRYDGREHLSPASHPDLKDRTVTLMGLSKTFSITGWRLGYLAAPKPLAEKIRLANDLFYVCAPTPLQHGVAAGFQLDPEHFKKMQAEFKVKRDKLCDALNDAGMTPYVPEGAYYILANIDSFKAPDSKVFAMSLLESAGVATIPGRAFFSGPEGENYIRANFAVNDEILDEACKRIRKFKGSF